MATKKEVLEAALRGEGCLGRAADDEPVFVVRAHDSLAPAIVDTWANWAAGGGSPPEKVTSARADANAIRDWQSLNGHKMPD